MIQEQQYITLCEKLMDRLSEAANAKASPSKSEKVQAAMGAKVNATKASSAPDSVWVQLNSFYFTKYFNILNVVRKAYVERVKIIEDTLS
jgi:hypothetical protein